MPQASEKSRQDVSLPRIQTPIVKVFRRFCRSYLRKHFHTVSINSASLTAAVASSQSGSDPGGPDPTTDTLLVYANHASWWDPITAIYLADSIFPQFDMYAPIDAEAFEKYRMFGRMGFYPIEQNSQRGAANFLRISKAIMGTEGSSIWLTPEGRFCDVRDQTATLNPGLAHLANAISSNPRIDRRTWFVPVAVEYTFWEERNPELLAWLGNPIVVSSDSQHLPVDKPEWDQRLGNELRSAQAELANASIARDTSLFEVTLHSKSGSFFIYDWWRRATSRLRGSSIEVEHSDKFNR